MSQRTRILLCLLLATLTSSGSSATGSIPAAQVMTVIAECEIEGHGFEKVTVWHDFMTLLSGTPPSQSSGAIAMGSRIMHNGLTIRRDGDAFSVDSLKTQGIYVRLNFDLTTGEGILTDLWGERGSWKAKCKRLDY